MLVRFLVTAMLAAGVVFAQGRGGGGMGDGMGGEGGMGGGSSRGGGMGAEGMGGGMPRASHKTKAEIFSDKLKLNKDQKEEAHKILSDAAQKAAPVANQIGRGRQAIATAILQKKTDAEIKPMMDAYAGLCAQMTGLETEAFGKIYAILKPNQQKNAAQAFELMDGIFIQVPSMGGGRGTGRGQGMGGGSRSGRN